MNGLYGDFSEAQLNEFKKKLHSKIHWLLIYKEADDCQYFEEYFETLMKYIGSLNVVFGYNSMIIELLTTLQMAYDESKRQDFNFKTYRKYVLDAHNIVDKI